jgi:hypothetical protein
MQPRAGRPVRDAERLGNVHQWQTHVVVEDEDGPLIERELAERPLQLVAVEECSNVVRRAWPIER